MIEASKQTNTFLSRRNIDFSKLFIPNFISTKWKQNVCFCVSLLLISGAAYAQSLNKLNLNIGVTYLFTKSKLLKPNLEVSTALNFGVSNYLYIGPKVTMMLLNEKPLFDVGPSVAFSFWKFANEKISEPADNRYQNVDMFITSFFGFNLVGATKSKKRFNFTNFNVTLDLSSLKVLDNTVYLSYGRSFIFDRFENDLKAHRLGLGGNFKL
jgi:hypothetical protein